MTGEIYDCAICHKTYRRTVSDEVAMAEMKATWVDMEGDGIEVVCEDCYKLICIWAELDAPQYLKPRAQG